MIIHQNGCASQSPRRRSGDNGAARRAHASHPADSSVFEVARPRAMVIRPSREPLPCRADVSRTPLPPESGAARWRVRVTRQRLWTGFRGHWVTILGVAAVVGLIVAVNPGKVALALS